MDMRASINWLRDYVDFSETPEQLAEILTMAGVPVEGIEYLGQGIENVITGKITGIEQHPNANKLSVCRVDIGKELLTIVTGATNIKVDNIVPIAMVGAKLPNNIEIQASNLRGVDSFGMMCSTSELNIDSKLLAPEDREGIYILPDTTPIGVDIKEVIGLNDVVLEFELTANRADCFSIIGLAREIAVLTGGALKKPMLSLREASAEKTANLVTISIEEPELCSRFAARVLQDIKIDSSPLWMQHRLRSAGMRPINNIVDVTNFVMLEMGQPMHAYDYNLLSKHSIVVRRANPGERLTTLDGIKRELTGDMLVIADAGQAVGIAGVMGGLATEVTNRTRTVLLEAAAFNGASIRRTSRALGLRSEASGRFERGVDTANIMRALDRASMLLEEFGSCKSCQGVSDKYPAVLLPKQVDFTADQINAYLGSNIEKAVMVDILKRLGFEVEPNKENILVTVPTWRGDISIPADISEEIARIYGYDNIPSTTPEGKVRQGGENFSASIANIIKDLLSGAGFDEVVTFSFTHPQVLDKLNIPHDSPLRKVIPVLNPITEELPALRTTLMGGILQTIVRNLARKNEDLRIYEIGAIYLPDSLPIEALPKEPVKLCGALVGKRNETSWNAPKDYVDFYDAKGTVDLILDGLGIEYKVISGEHSSLHPGKTAIYTKNEQIIAVVGEVHPKVLDDFEINRKVFLFEIDVDNLTKQATLINKYRPLPKFPAINRDLAVILPTAITADSVRDEINKSAGSLLSAISLFDVYTGEQVPPGFKSMAFSLTFQAQDRTLTDLEVDEHYKRIVVHLEEKITAKLRK